MIETIPDYTWYQWLGIILTALSAGYLAMFVTKIIRLWLKVRRMKEAMTGNIGEQIAQEGMIEEMQKEMEGLDTEAMMEGIAEMQEAQNLEENLSEEWDNE